MQCYLANGASGGEPPNSPAFYPRGSRGSLSDLSSANQVEVWLHQQLNRQVL